MNNSPQKEEETRESKDLLDSIECCLKIGCEMIKLIIDSSNHVGNFFFIQDVSTACNLMMTRSSVNALK